jgi:hypothetical protein
LKEKKIFFKNFFIEKKNLFFFSWAHVWVRNGACAPHCAPFLGYPKNGHFLKKCRYLVLYKLAGFCKAAWKGRRNFAGVHKNGIFKKIFFFRKISRFQKTRNLRTGNQRCYRDVFDRCARNDNREAIQLRSKTIGARVRNYTLTPSTSSIRS